MWYVGTEVSARAGDDAKVHIKARNASERHSANRALARTACRNVEDLDRLRDERIGVTRLVALLERLPRDLRRRCHVAANGPEENGPVGRTDHDCGAVGC